MTTFSPQTVESLIFQLNVLPADIDRFRDVLKVIEVDSVSLGIDYVGEITRLSGLIAAMESAGTSAAIAPGGLDAVVSLQSQGVKTFRTEELTVEFTGTGWVSDKQKYRNQILALLQGFGYYMGGDSLLLRS